MELLRLQFLLVYCSKWYHVDDLVEEEVGKYYNNEDNERKFHFVDDD